MEDTEQILDNLPKALKNQITYNQRFNILHDNFSDTDLKQSTIDKVNKFIDSKIDQSITEKEMSYLFKFKKYLDPSKQMKIRETTEQRQMKLNNSIPRTFLEQNQVTKDQHSIKSIQNNIDLKNPQQSKDSFTQSQDNILQMKDSYSTVNITHSPNSPQDHNFALAQQSQK